jgi:plasmid stability protein
MKTTLELPDDLVRAVRIRAAERNMKLKDVVAEALRAGLAADEAQRFRALDPVQALGQRMVFHADGTVTNPAGIDDAQFFSALDELRTESRRGGLRDPLEEH